MNLYEKQIRGELSAWRQDILKREGIVARASRGIQERTRKLMPRKAQSAITVAVEKFIKTMIFGVDLFSIQEDTADLTLSERDYLALHSFDVYQKTAVTEEALTGAGGFIVGLADLPALLGVQVVFLANTAKIYGFDPNAPSERLYMLYVFQIAFSGRAHRKRCLEKLEKWDDSAVPDEPDWEALQMEYRDYLDIAKLLQLLPVIGAPVGALANHHLMKRLRDNTINAYRMRILGKV
jgi:hypothetical protein